MVIFNEKKYVKEIIEQHNRDRKININKLIKYIVRYYYEDYKDAPLKDYIRKVLDVVNTFEYDEVYYREFMGDKIARRLCKQAQKDELNCEFREIDSVSVTEAEMEIIEKGKNDRERKLLFTLYVLAKVYGYHSGWVNYPPSEIFKLANITLNYEDRFLLIHELYKAGLIQLNHIIGKTGYKVELHEDSPVAITVPNDIYDKPDHFGNQYMVYKKGEDWTMCKECGRLIKKHSPNQKYCQKCAEKKHNMDAAERKRKSRQRCHHSGIV